MEGFTGGPMVKNSPCNAGDTSLIPALEASHMPWDNYARAPKLLSLCSRAYRPQLLKPTPPRAHALQQEKPPQWEAHTPPLERSPHSPQLEKARTATKTQLSHESESHSVMSNSLQTHGLYSPWNSPGQNAGVDSPSLLQGIFPTQVSRIAGRFFTSWATREAQNNHK